MENASKALLMAASILISIMVISIGTYIFNIFGTFAKNREEELYNYQINEFNTQFTKYETLEEVSIHEIITLANYAKDYNEYYGITDKTDNAYINVQIRGKGNIESRTTEDKNEIIKDATSNNYKYELENIKYNSSTGRVNLILFKKK